jgi:CRP-like cAMP-binding protein
MAASNATFNNLFLKTLADEDLDYLTPSLEPVDLPRDMILSCSVRDADYVYFPDTGLASIVISAPDGRCLEVGLVGFEGLSAPLHDVQSLHKVVLIPGRGWRVDARDFGALAQRSGTFLDSVSRYADYLTTQIAFTGFAHGTYPVPSRIARWLLMAQDRVGDDIAMAQEKIAEALSVSRSSVSKVLVGLEAQGTITLNRKVIRVVERGPLIRAAGTTYGVPEKTYARLFGHTSLSGHRLATAPMAHSNDDR